MNHDHHNYDYSYHFLPITTNRLSYGVVEWIFLIGGIVQKLHTLQSAENQMPIGSDKRIQENALKLIDKVIIIIIIVWLFAVSFIKIIL